MDQRGPGRHLHAAAKAKAGIDPGFHFHDLRHTTASLAEDEAGCDDLTVMTLMGHSDFNMMKRYAHLTPEHLRAAVRETREVGAGEAG